MNTLQEPPNGHHPFPPPCSVESPAKLNSDDLPANKATNSSTHPRDVQASAANVYLQDELRGAHIETSPQPDRCQFTFSDGRQCTMARSDIHPSLCRFHSEREDQLFGEPAPYGVVGARLDLPELHSACGDLSTAAGVNRALAQVFRLLAQRRISRQEAATFGHLAQLLLRTISLARAEFDAASRGDLASDDRKAEIRRSGSPANKSADPANCGFRPGNLVRDSRNAATTVHSAGLPEREMNVSREPTASDERNRKFCAPENFSENLPVSSPVDNEDSHRSAVPKAHPLNASTRPGKEPQPSEVPGGKGYGK